MFLLDMLTSGLFEAFVNAETTKIFADPISKSFEQEVLQTLQSTLSHFKQVT